MRIPSAFCWTRVGVEAGQSLGAILRRKEEERASNAGRFFWGIGNAVGPSIAELIDQVSNPEVIFSPIKASPRPVDVDPGAVAAWTRAECLDGTSFKLPSSVLVTSRINRVRPKGSHYALVCFCREPLTETLSVETFDAGRLCNLISGRQVGASQVTAVVAYKKQGGLPARIYRALFRVRLVPPFFLRLRDPLLLHEGAAAASWDAIVSDAWRERLAPQHSA